MTLERLGGLAREPQPERVPARQQPARLGGGIEVVVREPRDLGQEPPAAPADPPVLPRDRRPRRLRITVEDRERRSLPHAADRGDDDLVPRQGVDRAGRGRDRAPPVAWILLRPAVGAVERGDRRPAEPVQRAVEADERRLGLGRAEVQPQDRRHGGAGTALAHAGRGSPSRRTSSGRRNQRRSSKSRPTAPGSMDGPSSGCGGLRQELARLAGSRRGATPARGGGARVGHLARRRSAMSCEAQRRLDRPGAVAPEAGRRVERGSRAAGASRRSRRARRHRAMKSNTASLDEVVEVHPHPAGLDALAAARDLALELVRASRGRCRAAGGRTGPAHEQPPRDWMPNRSLSRATTKLWCR